MGRADGDHLLGNQPFDTGFQIAARCRTDALGFLGLASDLFHGVSCGLQKCVAKALVRFEIGPFTPLVPSVDEHQSLRFGTLLSEGPAHGRAQPAVVACLRLALEQMRFRLPARRVVPTRHHAPHLHPGLVGLLLALGGVFLPVKDIAAKFRIGGNQVGSDVRWQSGVPREFNGGVETVGSWVQVLEGLNHGDIYFADAVLAAPLTPSRHALRRIWEKCRSIDQQQRAAVNADVSGIVEISGDVLDELQVVIGGVLLADQQVLLPSVPAPSPVFVGPAQAEGQV